MKSFSRQMKDRIREAERSNQNVKQKEVIGTEKQKEVIGTEKHKEVTRTEKRHE